MLEAQWETLEQREKNYCYPVKRYITCGELGMKRIPDNSIDLVVTDPPYIMNKTSGSPTGCSMKEKWQGNLKAGDKTANIINTIKFKDWLPDVYRILKNDSHCYIWVNDKNLSDLQVEAEKVGFRLHILISMIIKSSLVVLKCLRGEI